VGALFYGKAAVISLAERETPTPTHTNSLRLRLADTRFPWLAVYPRRSISDNIRHQLLTPDNLMQAEPRLLLQDFIQDPHNYVSILRAIAAGDRTQKTIGTRTGLAQGHVS
jgi:hypothetical protein